MCIAGLPLSSVMLEAPFNHIAEAALHFPLARVTSQLNDTLKDKSNLVFTGNVKTLNYQRYCVQPFSIVPWFEAAALAGLKYNNISFHSDI